MQFQCPHGLELLRRLERRLFLIYGFNALMGLSCYGKDNRGSSSNFCFNALMGLSCYSKNVQYFKFFMILFYTYLLFIGIY